jgi:signal transduction histidine kinase
MSRCIREFQGTAMDEASELIVYSRRLEEKSQELEAATKELGAANERLKELDKLKDDFVTTVSHELRTPLTSIRSFSEIVHDNPDLPVEERREFLQIIVQESERLTRLLNDILDPAKSCLFDRNFPHRQTPRSPSHVRSL